MNNSNQTKSYPNLTYQTESEATSRHPKNELNKSSSQSHTIAYRIPAREEKNESDTSNAIKKKKKLIKLKQKRIKLKLAVDRRRKILNQQKTKKILQRISKINRSIKKLKRKHQNRYSKRVHPLNIYMMRTSYKQQLMIRRSNIKVFRTLTKKAKDIKSLYRRTGNSKKRASLAKQYRLIMKRRKRIYNTIKDSTSILKKQKRISMLRKRKQMLLNRRRQLLRNQNNRNGFGRIVNQRTRRRGNQRTGRRGRRFIRRKINNLFKRRNRINQLIRKLHYKMRRFN
jgi:hypothetical protein